MIHFTADRLTAIVTQVFTGAGASPETAAEVATSLVENNLVGHDSHGVLRVGYYVDWIRQGRVNPRGEITVVRQSASTALLDGGWNFGQVVAHRAMDLAISKAREHDTAVVAMRSVGHTGRLGEYALQAAAAGMVGMVFSTGSGKGFVAPYLGTGRLLNTNPIAWAIPALSHEPVFMDFATSMVAQGKIQAAVDKGSSIPDGWMLDAAGNPTTDPTEQSRGGMLLPFGKHKGYCMSFLIEILSGGLTGTSCGVLPAYQPDYATVMMAVNIAAFQPLEEFRQLVDDMVAAAKAVRKAPGVSEILVPGEPEWRSREVRLREGIDIPDASWQRIVKAGAECGVTVTP
jgi:LDH2 family malate/lactate/ureidoglycolate dehydrogenase